MNLSIYSKDQDVNSFIQWIEQKLSNENAFHHAYIDEKSGREFIFPSIYSAFEQYEWKGRNFDENQKLLNKYSEEIKNGINEDDENKVKKACEDILKWGGVLGNSERGNKRKLNEINNRIDPNNQNSKLNIIDYLKNVREHLNIESCEDESIYYSIYYSTIHCNSGFSKIYSTIVDNFIIYDSRVSCALCYLIRLYKEENLIEKIPESLKFAYSVGRSENRNPDPNVLYFKKLYPYNYLKYNIIASWLLKLILEKTNSKFNDLPKNLQLRALESALFMIGYKIN